MGSRGERVSDSDCQTQLSTSSAVPPTHYPLKDMSATRSASCRLSLSRVDDEPRGRRASYALPLPSARPQQTTPDPISRRSLRQGRRASLSRPSATATYTEARTTAVDFLETGGGLAANGKPLKCVLCGETDNNYHWSHVQGAGDVCDKVSRPLTLSRAQLDLTSAFLCSASTRVTRPRSRRPRRRSATSARSASFPLFFSSLRLWN